MSVTREQLISIGFKPSKRKSPFAKKYDTLVYPLNDRDYLYLGYNPVLKTIDFKKIWKSFVDTDGNRCTYQITHLGDTSFTELKEYIGRHAR